MNAPKVFQSAALILTICMVGRVDSRCRAQPQPASVSATTSSTSKSNSESLRVQRRQFQAQELITAAPNTWIFNPGDPPQIVWRDIEEVRRLGFDGPLRVRWYN